MGVLATPINALADGFNNFVSGIGDFFTNLIDSLGSWFDDIGQWFANLVDNIGQWFTDLGNSIGQWFTNLVNDIRGLGESIGGWFNQLFSTLGEILNYLNPFHEKFFLKIAFIPSDGFISNKFDELKDVLDDRLPIIGTFTEIFNSMTQAQSQVQSINSTSPTFTMELPDKWGGQTVEVINFDVIDPYVPFVKTLIRVFLWIPFIIKMYKRLPQVIY